MTMHLAADSNIQQARTLERDMATAASINAYQGLIKGSSSL